ncbi:hypothetical protein [Streptomyces synnematoformans]|uniref:Uncharacterized protein n=1 Tax=Streptomyces synnematoformans TaxID=415721 RepID=A0ABN2XVF7_9ACTN
MTQERAVAVEQLDGRAAAQAEDSFRLIYAEAIAEPPYNGTEHEVNATFRRFRSQTRKPAFSAALARTEDGEPAGTAGPR